MAAVGIPVTFIGESEALKGLSVPVTSVTIMPTSEASALSSFL